MARNPIGERAMTAAERQRRWRARHRIAAIIERDREQGEAARQQLRRAAPDLADDPEVRRTTYHLLFDFVRGLDAMINTPSVRCLPAILEVEEYEREFRQYFKGGVGELLEGLAPARDAARVAERLSDDLLVLARPRRRLFPAAIPDAATTHPPQSSLSRSLTPPPAAAHSPTLSNETDAAAEIGVA